jgi:hypothetical protein
MVEDAVYIDEVHSVGNVEAIAVRVKSPSAVNVQDKSSAPSFGPE